MIDNQAEKSAKTRFIGIGEFNVLAIQPNIEQLNEMGFKTDNFKSYYDKEKDQVRIDVIVRANKENITEKLSFWVQNKENVSSKEPYRKEYIDAHGNCTWCTEEELKNKKFTRKSKDFNTGEEIEVQFFFPQSARPALVGERQFTEFLRGWLALKPENNCQIPNIENLFKEDYSELQKIQNKNRVLIPLGIDQSTENLYYKFYTKAFCDSWGKSISSTWKKDLSKDKEKIAKIINEDAYKKAFFGEFPYEWEEYTNTEESIESTESTESTDTKSNDLPF